MATHTKEYWSAYYAKNKEKIKANSRKWYATYMKDPQYVANKNARGKEWRVKNHGYGTLYFRERYATDPEFRERVKERVRVSIPKYRARIYVRNHNYRARRLAAEGSFTLIEWQEILVRYNNRCAHCPATENLTVDHVIPLSKGGSNRAENLQPLCRSCNSKKSNKAPVLSPIQATPICF